MNKKTKYDPKVNLNMGFEEAMKRLSNVPKDKVDKNVKASNQRKKKK